jgi:hypothetical protein
VIHFGCFELMQTSERPFASTEICSGECLMRQGPVVADWGRFYMGGRHWQPQLVVLSAGISN